MQNLLDLDMAGLKAWLAQIGEKPFRANQLLRWIYQRGETDFSAMSDLARVFRERLPTVAEIRLPTIVSDKVSDDGTRKFLMDVGASNLIETVFIPETDRGTLCISTQVGCALDCSFCSTGKQGFNRNLTTAEIIGQLWLANRALGFDPAGDRIISNVVIMGMGEPLANFDALIPALNLMLDDHAYGLSRRRVTVSTSGIVPAMDRLREACPTALAVSLHAPNDALRDVLVPINQKYPLLSLWQPASVIWKKPRVTLLLSSTSCWKGLMTARHKPKSSCHWLPKPNSAVSSTSSLSIRSRVALIAVHREIVFRPLPIS